jgi:acetyl-CoA synthetase
VFTADEGLRGGKTVRLKETVDEALKTGDLDVKNVFIFKRTGKDTPLVAERDVLACEILTKMSPYCPVEIMDSEDPLFLLYTSGSTGAAKGLLHTTAGYLLNAALSMHTFFDLQKGDVFCCVADCGWVTGHTYIVYGPLCNGISSIIFESIPNYPTPYRYWDVVQRHKATQFYTAPTAIRSLMRNETSQYDLSTLRVIGSVGNSD